MSDRECGVVGCLSEGVYSRACAVLRNGRRLVGEVLFCEAHYADGSAERDDPNPDADPLRAATQVIHASLGYAAGNGGRAQAIAENLQDAGLLVSAGGPVADDWPTPSAEPEHGPDFHSVDPRFSDGQLDKMHELVGSGGESIAPSVASVRSRVAPDTSQPEPPSEPTSLYLRLKGAREKLCVAQTLIEGTDAFDTMHRQMLGEAVHKVDIVGGARCPQWSRFDREPAAVDASDAETCDWCGGSGFANRDGEGDARTCSRCGGSGQVRTASDVGNDEVAESPPKGACPFCDIAFHGAKVEKFRWTGDRVMSFEPLNPVTPGHRLFVPLEHVGNAGASPEVAARVMEAAARYVDEHVGAANIITSCGSAATQSVFHLHVHVVPRRFGDGLALPWSAASAAADSETLLSDAREWFRTEDEARAYVKGYRDAEEKR